MTGWAVRHPTLRDVPAILDVVGASGPPPTGEPDWSVEEIVATLTAPNHDPAHDSWLAVEPDGTAVAWAYLNAGDTVEVYAASGRAESAQRPLLELAIARVAERARDAGFVEVTLRAVAVASDRTYIAALERVGFAFVKRHARMRLALSGAERPAVDPRIRALRHEHEPELRRFHRVLEEAFADAPSDFATWRASIGALPSVTWDEWFVAEVDGVIVGALQSSDQGIANDEGWVKNVAVLRQYRSIGIGRGLLATAFATYAAKGRKWAGLGVDLSNPTGAHRLYASVGMAATFEAEVYERRITGGATRAPYP